MGYTFYEPLKVWLDPASITDVVAYIQTYLAENPISDEEDIENIVAEYIAAHPELIGGVQSVNGETGEVVLTASDINTSGSTTIQAVLTSLTGQISEIVQTITGLDTRITTNATGITNEATARANADTALGNRITALQGAVGSPLIAATAAAMTDTSKIYVYTGSETGYTNGNWYYYNGSAWASGGVYNAVAINTDTTLTVAGMAADAKATGDGLNDLKSNIDYELELNASLNNVVDLHTIDGVYSTYSVATVRKTNNLFFVDGTIQSNNTRFAITGSDLAFSSSSPTYARVPNWYVNDLTDFVVGHTYQMRIKLLSGIFEQTDPTQTNPYFTIRTTDQSLNVSLEDGRTWYCTAIPNMVCLVFRWGTANDCVYSYDIIDLTAQSQRIINQAGLFDYSVPTYFNTQLDTALTKINSDINSNKSVGESGTDIESFVFITDVHWSNNKQHSPGLIKRVLDSCPVKTVICGGDFIQNSNTKLNAVDEIKGFTDSIINIPCYDYYAVCGNHDSNAVNSSSISEQFTKEEEFNLIYAPFSYKSNVHWIWDDDSIIMSDARIKNDYYFDHARTKTRFLCIDWSHPYSTARTSWIESVLSKNDGFRVIIIYHGIYSASGGTLTPEHTTIMDIIAPYKTKIVALFTGHAHMDDVIDYYGDGSVPVIITSCDTFGTSAVADTKDEQCFDVAVVDYGQSKIELTRIGRGSNRTVTISLS